MWVNWKRCSFGALVLAALSLLLFGCGDFGSTQPTAVATKSISGIVSDPDNGLPMANASVTAYGVDSNGVVATTPLSVAPATVTSNSRGEYTLKIPASYTGSVVLDAEVPASPLGKLAKLLFRTPGQHFRSPVPHGLIGKAVIPPIMISLATDTVYQFVQQNGAATGGFTAANIQSATVVMEIFFGPNFNQTPPPQSASDTSTSRQQQDLIVSIRAFATVAGNPNTPIANIVSSLATTGLSTDIAGAIKAGITAATSALAAEGTLPPEYVPSAAINTAISNVTGAPAVIPPDVANDVTAPDAPTNLAATATGAKQVNLTWTASSAADLAGYTVCRADASGVFVAIDIVSAAATSYSDFRTQPQTGYQYRLIAFDQARNLSDPSNTASATTPVAVDTIPPDRVAGLVCKAFDFKQVNLQWQPATKTNANGTVIPAAGYYVYRDSVLVGTAFGNSFVDTGVQPLTQYSYYVKAFDALGNLSPASLPIAVFTAANPAATNVPAAPTNFKLATVTAPAVNPAYNNVALTWDASAGTNVTYNVYRDGVLIASGIQTTKYSDGSVLPSSTYRYAVTANGNGGESLKSQLAENPVNTPANPNSVDTTQPSAPANLQVVANASTSVGLMWTGSTMPSGSSFVAGYIVLRGDATGNNFVKVGTTVQPGFVDTSVASATSYTYEVIAFSSTGVLSNPAVGNFVVTTLPAVNLNDTTPPSAPTNLAAPTVSSASVTLTWTASTKNTGDQVVAGYRIFRKLTAADDTAYLQVGDVTATSFTDITVASSTGYTYKVVAYDNPGNVSAPATVDATTLAAAPNTFNIFGKVTLNGFGVSNIALTIDGGTTIVTTDANGNYAFTGLANGNYTVTPVVAGFFIFTPTSRNVTLNSANAAGVNFVAVLTGQLTTGVTFPDGTIIGGITYPPGSVIGGVTYPTGATVIGGVVYPTGSVIGGVTYPNGVVVAGVTYPPGTIIGGIAFPVGAVATAPNGIAYPSGIVASGTIFPVANTGVTTGTSFTVSGVSVGFSTGVLSFPSVSGSVSSGVTSVAGRIVLLTDANPLYPLYPSSIQTTTDNLGNYSFVGVKPGSYVLSMDAIPGRTFSPTSISVTVTTNSTIVGQNFTIN